MFSVDTGDSTGSVVDNCDDDITEAENDDAEVAGEPRDSVPAVMVMAAWWWAALWRFRSFSEGPRCQGWRGGGKVGGEGAGEPAG